MCGRIILKRISKKYDEVNYTQDKDQ